MDRESNNDGQPFAGTNASASVPPGGGLLPVAIPDHQLLRRIGRGSYGEVWLARNMMGMFRAVKIVHRRTFEHQRPFDRELSGIRKFEPISRSHEGFVDVLHVGINEAEGYFYYVMELGDNQALGQNIDPGNYSPRTLAREISAHGQLPFQECLQFGLALSLALHELHKHGLVHRDVKPSNIIFVNGVPKLADIGLVAEVDEARSYVGTEGFIPPEGPGAPTADVFSLGKVLYEAGTGKDRQEFPELPTRLDTFPDQDGFLELNEVILQACKPEVKGRYPSAWAMHADLLVIANGKSVKRLKVLERRLANLKRLVGLSALALLALAAVLYQVYREWRNTVDARQRQVGANVAYGTRAMESGDLLAALPYFTEALRLDQDDPNRECQHRLRIGSTLQHCVKLEQMFFTGHNLEEAVFSPDGRDLLITSVAGKARRFDAATGNALDVDFNQGALFGATYNPNGTLVATYGSDSLVHLWRANDGARVLTLAPPSDVIRARFSPDGSRLVTAGLGGHVRVWQARTGKLQLTLAGHTDDVRYAVFSHDGRLIATASRDHTARLWDANTGRAVSPPLEHGSWVNCAAFSPDNQRIVTGSFDHKAHVWEVATGKKILPELNHRDGIRNAEFSPDGRMILTACLDGTVRLWRADNLEPLGSNPILSHGSRVTYGSFDAEGRRIVTACSDGTVRIWDLAGVIAPPVPARCFASPDGSRLLYFNSNLIDIAETAAGQTVGSLTNGDGRFLQAMFARDGRHFLTLTDAPSEADQTNVLVQVWNAAGQAAGAALTITNTLTGARLSDDGKRLVTYGDQAAQVWDAAGTPVSPSLAQGEFVDSACFSPDGNRVGTLSGNQLRVWDAATGQLVFKPLESTLPLFHAAFSPDGSRLVTCYSDADFTRCYAQVWNAATGEPVGERLNHSDGVLQAAFSPDGRRVLTACEDFSAYEWEAATGKQLIPPLRHRHQVKSARFSPDGKWIVTASRDLTARIWSAETGDPLTPPLHHPAELENAQFLADGRRIITSDARGNSWIWDLPVDERPVEDLALFAQLLAPTGQASASPESLPGLWQRLRDKYPACFTTSAREIASWHERQAGDCEHERQWSAAVFHLEKSLALRPGDPALVERLGKAKSKVAASSGIGAPGTAPAR